MTRPVKHKICKICKRTIEDDRVDHLNDAHGYNIKHPGYTSIRYCFTSRQDVLNLSI